jgi:hypothetical protein
MTATVQFIGASMDTPLSGRGGERQRGRAVEFVRGGGLVIEVPVVRCR